MSREGLRTNSLVLVWMSTLWLMPLAAHAQQSRLELERQKRENLQKITRTQRILAETQHKKTASLGQLQALEQQVSTQQSLLKVYAQQLRNIKRDIGETSQIVRALESDLKVLGKEYGHMVYWAYKHRSATERLTFLFAANTFNQFLLRGQYVAQLQALRKLQLEEIQKVQSTLLSQHKSLVKKQRHQEQILSTQARERRKLLRLQAKQQKLLKSLTRKEKMLRKISEKNSRH